jgi:hypothetical protein
MALRIPTNQIVTSKYTVGKEYLVLSTYKEYQGYYYELNNKTFAGKEFNLNALELIKMDSDRVNSLLINPATSTYGKISKLKINNSNPTSYYFIPSEKDAQRGYTFRYFLSKVNSNPILIKEISEDDYNIFITNPLYITVKIINYIIQDGASRDNNNNNYTFTSKDIDVAEQTMPGIKYFLDMG